MNQTTRLTKTQVDAFQNEGYLILEEPLFPEEQFQALSAKFDGDVRLQPKWENQLRLYPARGSDKAGNNLADPTRAYPELAEGNRTGRKVH